MFMRIVCTLLVCHASLAVAPVASASDITVPAGFKLESVPGPGPVAAILDDGSVLLSTGSFGADQLDLVGPGGVLIPFATGFGSIAGVARSPVSGDIIVGDSFGATSLWVLRDLNNDLDAMDPGEKLPHPAQLPVLSNGAAPLPYDLAFRPGTDELYMTGSTPFGFEPLLGVVIRIAGGAADVYVDGLGYAGGLVFDGDELYVADLDGTTFVGRVLTLSDGNLDGDALDAGESVAFASGLTGAGDIVRASDGSFWLSGLFDVSDFSGSVGRLLPDDNDDGASDAIDEAVFDGFPFTTTLILLEGPGGFLSGVDGDGLLIVGDFSFTGNRVFTPCPAAQTSVAGTVANDSTFHVSVAGDPGAEAFYVASLDPVGVTIGGLGDVCFGFNAPLQISAAKGLDAAGQASWNIVLHGLPGLVGLDLAIQGFVVEDGEFGVGNGLSFIIGD